MKRLRLALIHFSVQHKQPVQNREKLTALVSEAARQGAGFIVGPELAVSGYSFDSREDMIPYAETDTGPTLSGLAAITRSYGIYACIGMAEKDTRTGILYNSAFVLNPKGRLCCRYRKMNAESRWACPGDPRQDNTFETPWGRVGILICSDSYHGLMPRVTALRGADLLIVPANWPLSGLDPREMWRARALENGFYVAACNRTGVDLNMDCREAPSFGCDPRGRILLEGRDADSHIFWIDLPLAARGRLDDRTRWQCLAGRRTRYYHDAYLNLQFIRGLTRFLDLPQPGNLDLCCVVPAENEHPAEALERNLPDSAAAGAGLYLVPLFDDSDSALERIAQLARQSNTGVLTCTPAEAGSRRYIFQDRSGMRQWRLPPWPFDGDAVMPRFDFGPARLLVAPLAALAHPELAAAAAKQGCDVALALEETLSEDQRLLAGVRTIENLALAVCARNGAGIWLPPEGHQRWEETTAGPGQACSRTLDTHRTRLKRFQDRIDFETLLRQPPLP